MKGFEIVVEYDNGMEQETFGPFPPFPDVNSAYEAMAEVLSQYPTFDWVQISREK